MRRRLTITLALATLGALLAAASATAVLTAPDGNTQSILANVSPNRLSKKKPAPVTLEVTTKTTSATNPTGVPVPAVQAIIDFDKHTSIFSRGYPTCSLAEIQNTSTETALRVCKRAKIGSGNATALIPVGVQVFVEHLTVTAFNGQPQGRKPVILLHSYGRAPVQTTTVLTGVVSNYDREGYGPRLNVKIPLIAGGLGALTEFHTAIFKRFAYKGVKRSYVSSTCPATKKLKSRGKFVFEDGESLTPTSVQRCVPKG
ncbi:MAG TPA: hypothetical protein VFP23_07615 [Solirubrobacterales bacterium]|nr:hypothetical protein [Solirubrobacterales bacterium]